LLLRTAGFEFERCICARVFGVQRVAAALDVARTIVRRAERESVAAARDGWLDDSHVVPYLNRLADLVYTLARWQEGAYRPVRTGDI